MISNPTFKYKLKMLFIIKINAGMWSQRMIEVNSQKLHYMTSGIIFLMKEPHLLGSV